MESFNKKALIIVDMERGFMPASEGERLGLRGFGELGVTGGELIIPGANQLTDEYVHQNLPIAATFDYHPEETAHFSDNPNYVNTWPKHCVGGTLGAELHPDLRIAKRPELATRFIKGDTPCDSPEDDTSYTGALAYDPQTGTYLPDWLREQNVTEVDVIGLAKGDGGEHKLCVDSTAVDLHNDGFRVNLVSDVSEFVDQNNREVFARNMGAIGINLITLREALAALTPTEA